MYSATFTRATSGGREFNAEWRTERADFKVNCAGGDCNAGWMNDLDHAAEGVFVTAAANGHEVKLPSRESPADIGLWSSFTTVSRCLAARECVRVAPAETLPHSYLLRKGPGHRGGCRGPSPSNGDTTRPEACEHGEIVRPDGDEVDDLASSPSPHPSPSLSRWTR